MAKLEDLEIVVNNLKKQVDTLVLDASKPKTIVDTQKEQRAFELERQKGDRTNQKRSSRSEAIRYAKEENPENKLIYVEALKWFNFLEDGLEEK